MKEIKEGGGKKGKKNQDTASKSTKFYWLNNFHATILLYENINNKNQ